MSSIAGNSSDIQVAVAFKQTGVLKWMGGQLDAELGKAQAKVNDEAARADACRVDYNVEARRFNDFINRGPSPASSAPP